jgi:hypothetical protein
LKVEETIEGDPAGRMNLSCGAADQVSLGEAEGPKTRRVPGGEGGPCVARGECCWLLGCWKGEKEGKERAMDNAPFLYHSEI